MSAVLLRCHLAAILVYRACRVFALDNVVLLRRVSGADVLIMFASSVVLLCGASYIAPPYVLHVLRLNTLVIISGSSASSSSNSSAGNRLHHPPG